MSRSTIVVPSTAKAKVAAIGNTLAAVMIFIGVLAAAMGDDAITAEEITPLVVGFVTLATTVYAVWRVPNRPQVVSTNPDRSM